jgi:hypothetical protein
MKRAADRAALLVGVALPDVAPLLDLLSAHVSEPELASLPPAQRLFIDNVMVARPPNAEPPTATRARRCGLPEVLTRALEHILKESSLRPGNVLALGYRAPRLQESSTFGGSTAVQNFYPNTIIEFLQEPSWVCLHELIGDELFFYLLTATALFWRLDRGCVVQLCGPPISALTHTNDPIPALKRPRMVSHCEAAPSKPAAQRPKPALLRHSAIFYSQALCDCLPRTHVLNQVRCAAMLPLTQPAPALHPRRPQTRPADLPPRPARAPPRRPPARRGAAAAAGPAAAPHAQPPPPAT